MYWDADMQKNLKPKAWKSPYDKEVQSSAIAKVIKKLGAKDAPAPITWDAEHTEWGDCPICEATFKFENLFGEGVKEQRCPKCNQLFSIDIWIS